MKRWIGVLTAIMILAAQAGCSLAPASSRESGSAVSAPAGSATGSPESGLKPGEHVRMTGEDNNYRLSGIDFLDAKTGWIIQTREPFRSQLLKTDDGGLNWAKAGGDSRGLGAVRFTSPDEGWAVAYDAPDPSQTRYQILHSTDGGESWNVQWKSDQETFTDSSLWFGRDGESGYALLGRRLLKTADSGRTWTDVSFGAGDFSPAQICFSDEKTGWAAGVNHRQTVLSVRYTADGGRSWKTEFQKNNYHEGTAECAGFNFLNNREGWLLTAPDVYAHSKGELYHTADAGRNWRKTSEVALQQPVAKRLCFVDSETGWLPLDFGGLSVTHDGGKSFQTVGASNRGDIRDTQKISGAEEIAFPTKQIGLAVGTNLDLGEYLLRTGDGGKTWEQVYPRLQPTRDLSFVSSQAGYGLGARSDPNALLKTENGGGTWKTVKSFTGESVVRRLSFVGPEEGFLLTAPVDSSPDTFSVLHTADGGKTWSKSGNVAYHEGAVCYFRFFDAKNGIIAGEGEKETICRTSDGGKTWNASALKQPENAAGQFAFLSPSAGWLVCSPSANGNSGQISLSRLAPDGKSWQAPVSAARSAGSCALFFSSAQNGMVLAQGNPEQENSRFDLLTTSDAGKTWASHPLPEGVDPSAFDLTLGQPAIRNQCPMQFADDAHGWILSVQGLLATTDGGRTWSWQ